MQCFAGNPPLHMERSRHFLAGMFSLQIKKLLFLNNFLTYSVLRPYLCDAHLERFYGAPREVLRLDSKSVGAVSTLGFSLSFLIINFSISFLLCVVTFCTF